MFYLHIFPVTSSYSTTIGTNEIGFFIGDGECRIQFTHEEMDALILGRIHAQHLADAFVNFVSATLASGEIPSCFRQDLSPDDLGEIKKAMPAFRLNFCHAFSNLMLIFEH